MLLPPQLGIGDSFEVLAENPQARAHLILGTRIRGALPYKNPYYNSENAAKFADDHVAITCIDYWQAQALAQLLGDKGLADELFGVSRILGGAFYADLLTNAQWGLMAMEGFLEYMTRTGELTDDDGNRLRAFDLPHIVRATDYPALPNGILPNLVWNWVKDVVKRSLYQVLRGGAWHYGAPDYLRSAYHLDIRPDRDDNHYVGARVGFFPRTS